ncbi:glycosyltransferase [uncultured Psychrobacter sp.]|uniref:glycosyltransferase n=1 Tax=uncultured Psychrobacter sp. TaxID=259303 RepID=UPI00259A7F75|nr:glycosyltransferase [uncultured Psychrobacter sp.]
MNKNISFLISDLKNSGGTQRMLCCLSNLLIDQFDITIFISDEGDSFFYLDSRVQIVVLPSGKKSIIRRTLDIYNILQTNKTKYFINLDSNSILFNSLLLPRTTKLILWEHFSITDNFKKPLFTVSRHYGVYRCQKIVLLSKHEIKSWIEYNSHIRDKCRLIYNPLSIDIQDIETSNKWHLKTFLAIGNDIEVKGFDILLEAWQAMDTDWKLQIVGIKPNQLTKLEQLVKSKNIKNVELYGKVKNIKSFYKEASVFLLPSRKEATPLVLIESQAYGLPAIVFDHLPGVLELLDDSALIADYRNKEVSFLQAMESITKDKTLYKNIHHNALKNSEKYSLDNFKQNWLEILV